MSSTHTYFAWLLFVTFGCKKINGVDEDQYKGSKGQNYCQPLINDKLSEFKEGVNLDLQILTQ